MQAFIRAAEPSPHYSHLLANMKGIIFLGTPHRGAPLAKQLQRVIKATINSKVCLEQLQSSCETVEAIFSSFNELEVSKKHSVSFYESMSMSLFDHVKLRIEIHNWFGDCCAEKFRHYGSWAVCSAQWKSYSDHQISFTSRSKFYRRMWEFIKGDQGVHGQWYPTVARSGRLCL